MVPRLLAAARAMRSRTCADVIQPCLFWFDSACPEKSCFVVDLVCFISLWLRVAVFLNAARKDINLPPFAS